MTVLVKDALGVNQSTKTRVDGGEHVWAKDIERIKGAASIATGQASVTSTTGLLIAARATRRRAKIMHHGDGDPVFLGPASVAIGDGYRLVNSPGAEVELLTAAAIHAVVAANAATISFVEEFD